MPKAKTLYLVRHAQSEENVKVHHLLEGVYHARQGHWPGWEAVTSALSLLQLAVESPVSKQGKRQILDMHMVLRDAGFWARVRPGIVVSSPLSRARDTCEGLLPPPAEREPLGLTAQVRADLEEATPYEHVVSRTLMERIGQFKRWLADCEHDAVVVFGHSQYFLKMLGVRSLMRNCDVWQVTMTTTVAADGVGYTYAFDGLQLLHRTELADEHPWDALKAKLAQSSSSSTSGSGSSGDARAAAVAAKDDDNDDDDNDDEVVNDLTDDPACRICQMTASETPGMRLIKPCKCAGTLQHVHVDCLNRWRETSSTAHTTCSVCGVEYRVTRTYLADVLMSEYGACLVTGLGVLWAIGLSGWALCHVGMNYLRIDVAGETFRFMEVNAWWRYCLLDYSDLERTAHLVVQPGTRWDDVLAMRRAAAAGGLAGAWAYCHRVGSVAWLTVRALLPPAVVYLAMCNGPVSAAVDVVVCGVLVVGGAGFAHYIYGEVASAIRDGAFTNGAGILENQGLQRLGMLGMWLGSLGNRALSRLALVGGVCMALANTYKWALVRGRALAHYLGEQIEEYSQARRD